MSNKIEVTREQLERWLKALDEPCQCGDSWVDISEDILTMEKEISDMLAVPAQPKHKVIV